MASEVGRCRPRAAALVAVLALWVAAGGAGCGYGFVYTHVTEPLDADFDRTPVQTGSADDSVKSFRYYVQVDWGQGAIGAIAKEHGLERVYYADLETIRVLNVWTQRFVVVYGD